MVAKVELYTSIVGFYSFQFHYLNQFEVLLISLENITVPLYWTSVLLYNSPSVFNTSRKSILYLLN